MLSVLMSVYNSQIYLREAIESTLAQTHRDFEFLIVDDGSTDYSLEICREYARLDARIRVIAHANWGAAQSLNDAAAEARYEWLFRMDPDDVMMPNRIERQLAFLQANPDLAVASSLVYLIDSAGLEIGKSRSPYTTRQMVRATLDGPALVGFHHPAVAMRKSIMQQIGGYRPEYWPADDLDLWDRIGQAGHMMLVQPEYLMKYRVHASSISMAARRRQVLTMDWVEDSKHRRRAGLPEISYATFLAERDHRPWSARLNDHRRMTGRLLYKAAVHHWSTHDYLRFGPELAGALVLQPELVLPRVLPRLAG